MNNRPSEEQISIFHGETFFFVVRDGVQYLRIFPIHSRINPFYSRNVTFITQEITNTLLKKCEGPLKDLKFKEKDNHKKRSKKL